MGPIGIDTRITAGLRCSALTLEGWGKLGRSTNLVRDVETGVRPRVKGTLRVTYMTPEQQVAALERAAAKRPVRRSADLGHPLGYEEYLQSTEWAAKRDEALEFWGDACRLCGTTKRVTIHHLSYDRLGQEPMRDLMPLCWTHHAAAHRLDRQHPHRSLRINTILYVKRHKDAQPERSATDRAGL